MTGILLGGALEGARAQNAISTIKDNQGNAALRIFDNGNLELLQNGKITTPGKIESTSGGIVLPDGTVLDKSSDLGQLALPFDASGSTSNINVSLFELEQTGTSIAGSFSINNSGNTAPALTASSNGSGPGVRGHNSGTGQAGLFQIFNSSSSANALVGATNGSGAAVKGFQDGSGRAGFFQISNQSSSANALFARTNGTGNVLRLNHQGSSGSIAVFQDGGSSVATVHKSGVIESSSGGFKLPDGTVLDKSSDLGGVPILGNGAFDLSNDNGLVAPGTLGSGSIPTSGAGVRMMWYPKKAAFRAGQVKGSQWDASNVGTGSVAFGINAKASGEAATAMGRNTTASGVRGATAMGQKTVASNQGTTAMGRGTKASGIYATAMGNGSTASEAFTTAMGFNTTAATPKSLSIGTCNDANTTKDNTLFVVGNGSQSGSSCSSRSDALVLSKDGNLKVTAGSGDAFRAVTAGDDGFEVETAGGTGFQARTTDVHGVLIEKVGSPSSTTPKPGAKGGFEVWGSEGNGLAVGRADLDGAHVKEAGDDGFEVEDAGGSGFQARAAANHGVFVAEVGSPSTVPSEPSPKSAFEVKASAGNGLSVARADKDGVFVDEAGGFAADLEVSKSQGASNPNGHAVLVENSGGSNADGLAIQAGANSNPDRKDNFITFYDGDGDPVGTVQGNPGSDGVSYETSGKDFAEKLPVAEGATEPEPKDLIGVRGGTASLRTEGADRVMIVSGQAAMVGGASFSEETGAPRRVTTAFIGQVPVRLRGTAGPGDLVVASGKNDGTARAVSPSKYRREKHGPIAGQAWEAKSSKGIGEVTVAVGLGQSGAVAKRLEKQQKQISGLKAENKEMKRQQKNIKKRLARLEAKSNDSILASLPGSGLLLGLLVGGLLGAGLFRTRS